MRQYEDKQQRPASVFVEESNKILASAQESN
jgi:hypothetical protein